MNKDIVEIIDAISWLLEKDGGAISKMHRLKLDAIKYRLKPNICVHCKCDIIGTIYGAGDGRGQQFQCESCYKKVAV